MEIETSSGILNDEPEESWEPDMHPAYIQPAAITNLTKLNYTNSIAAEGASELDRDGHHYSQNAFPAWTPMPRPRPDHTASVPRAHFSFGISDSQAAFCQSACSMLHSELYPEMPSGEITLP